MIHFDCWDSPDAISERGFTKGVVIRTSMKLSLAGLAALSGLGLVASPASAQTQGITVATVKAHDAKIKDFASCDFDAVTPGYLTPGKIGGSGKIKACGPVPDKCRLQTSIMVGPVSTIAHKDTGWGKCRGTNKLVYKCANRIHKQTFYTESVMQIEWRGQHASKIAHSPKATLYCG
ncbi:hypothetical protein AB0O20_30835 [Streptomyces kronopolitis]|uniref:hypothetical protein n=1 Tax=Streptomyces kronopolitis TaxID=1612435 RepID=UPI003416B2F2